MSLVYNSVFKGISQLPVVIVPERLISLKNAMAASYSGELHLVAIS